MKKVYEIHLPSNDKEGAMCDSSYLVEVPTVVCPDCGLSTNSQFWWASLKPHAPFTPELAATVPKKAASYEEYCQVLGRLKEVFGANDQRILPGSFLGATGIPVRSRSTIGGLTNRKLKDGIDVIHATNNWIFSQRVIRALADAGCHFPSSPVFFSSGAETLDGYAVDQTEPIAVLDPIMYSRFQLSVCDRCGSALRLSLIHI